MMSVNATAVQQPAHLQHRRGEAMGFRQQQALRLVRAAAPSLASCVVRVKQNVRRVLHSLCLMIVG